VRAYRAAESEPQLVHQVRRSIGFVQHQPNQIRILGNRLRCGFGDAVQRFNRSAGVVACRVRGGWSTPQPLPLWS
jgi:hypothetical protein